MHHWLVIELCNLSEHREPLEYLEHAFRTQLKLDPSPAHHPPAATPPSHGDLTVMQVPTSTSSPSLRSTFLGSGAVRLYYNKGDSSDQGPLGLTSVEHAVSIPDASLVAILALPSYFLPTDLVDFLGPSTIDAVVHICMIHSSTSPERSLVLLRFKTPQQASHFFDDFNLRPFNSMDAHVCHVAKIDRLVVSGQSSMNTLRDLAPFSSTSSSSVPQSSSASTSDSVASGTSRPTTSDPTPSAQPVELPLCPVCLERMDSNATGLLTIPCQHTFHCTCLAQWPDSSCPVCRHGKLETDRSGGRTVQSHTCCQCPSIANLWVCIICGSVGCGRYDNAHAFAHYKESGHCFAMDLNTQRIWDYSSDAYVHRLLQNQADGKIVELPSPELKQQAKIDKEDLAVQYTHLLSTQLESQRDYYESLVASSQSRVAHLEQQNETIAIQNTALVDKCKGLESQNATLDRRLGPMENSIAALKKENVKTQASLKTALKAHADEKELTDSLVEKLETAHKRQTELESTCADLQEQVRDLLFFLDARDKLADADQDVTQGTVVVPSSSSKKKKKKK